jgi:hypothetical protein
VRVVTPLADEANAPAFRELGFGCSATAQLNYGDSALNCGRKLPES